MKKKTIAIICSVVVLAAAGGGIGWKFLGNHSSAEENVVYVNTVESLMNLGTGNGMQNRYAGVVESQNSWKVEKTPDKTVKDIFVEVGQEVQKGTPLFTYDTDKFNSDLEQAKLDLERINNELSSMNANLSQLYKEKKQAPKDQQASLTLDIQEAELDLKKKEYDGKEKQAEIDKLNDNILNATVVSEIDGVVKSIQKDDQSGDLYDSGSDNSFLTVLATGDFQVKGKINEQNMYDGSLTEGTPVIVHSRADEEQTWTGTVTKIDRENAESSNSNMYGYMDSDSMTQSSSYPFYVRLDRADGLMLGQHVYVEPDVGQEEQKTGVWLFDSFLNDVDSKPYVWADDGNGKLEKRYVTLGEYDENLKEYEIIDGLTEEDAITFPEDGLEEGMKTVVSTDGMMGQSNPAGGDDAMDDIMTNDDMTDDAIPDDAATYDAIPEEGMTDEGETSESVIGGSEVEVR